MTQVTFYKRCKVSVTVLNKPAMEIRQKLCAVYSERCMSIQMDCRWMKYYREGKEEVHDVLQTRRPSDSMNFETFKVCAIGWRKTVE